MTRGVLLALPLSLAFHLVALAALVTLLPGEDTSSPLFIDLTLASEPAPAAPAPAPTPAPRAAGRPPMRSIAPAPHLARSSARAAASPASAPPAAPLPEPPPTQVAAPPPEPEPTVAAPEPVTPPASAVARANEAPPRERPPATDAMADRRASLPSSTNGVAASPPGIPGAAGSGSAQERAGGGASRGATGGATGALSAAVGGGGDTPGAEYGPYLASVRRQIAESLRYPPAARRRGLTGTVQLEIMIQANGAVGSATVVESSSHALLDEAALETVRALPRIPFPAALPPRRLRVRLPVIFNLE